MNFWIMGEFLNYGWNFELCVWDRQTDTPTHSDTHINTMTRPGLRAGSSENIFANLSVGRLVEDLFFGPQSLKRFLNFDFKTLYSEKIILFDNISAVCCKQFTNVIFFMNVEKKTKKYILSKKGSVCSKVPNWTHKHTKTFLRQNF